MNRSNYGATLMAAARAALADARADRGQDCDGDSVWLRRTARHRDDARYESNARATLADELVGAANVADRDELRIRRRLVRSLKREHHVARDRSRESRIRVAGSR